MNTDVNDKPVEVKEWSDEKLAEIEALAEEEDEPTPKRGKYAGAAESILEDSKKHDSSNQSNMEKETNPSKV